MERREEKVSPEPCSHDLTQVPGMGGEAPWANRVAPHPPIPRSWPTSIPTCLGVSPVPLGVSTWGQQPKRCPSSSRHAMMLLLPRWDLLLFPSNLICQA